MDMQTAILIGKADGLRESLNNANSTIHAQNAEIQHLRIELAKAQANGKGCSAQTQSLLDENPNTKLRELSNIKYKSKDGFKSKLRLIYEKAFDAFMRERGITNPADYRID